MSAYIHKIAGVNIQNGPTYAVQLSDNGMLISIDSAVPVAVSLPNANTLPQDFWVAIANIGTGLVTITPTGCNIDNGANTTLSTGSGAFVYGNALNYYAMKGGGGGGGGATFTSISNGTNTTAAMIVGTGASLTASGTGVIEATELQTTGAAVAVGGSAPPAHAGQLLISQPGNVTAVWADPLVQGLYADGTLVSTPINPVYVGGKSTDGKLYGLLTDSNKNLLRKRNCWGSWPRIHCQHRHSME